LHAVVGLHSWDQFNAKDIDKVKNCSVNHLILFMTKPAITIPLSLPNLFISRIISIPQFNKRLYGCKC